MIYEEITTRTQARDSIIEWAEGFLSDAVNDPKCPQYLPGCAETLIADVLEMLLSTEDDAKVRKLYQEAGRTEILRNKLESSIELATESPELFK